MASRATHASHPDHFFILDALEGSHDRYLYRDGTLIAALSLSAPLSEVMFRKYVYCASTKLAEPSNTIVRTRIAYYLKLVVGRRIHPSFNRTLSQQAVRPGSTCAPSVSYCRRYFPETGNLESCQRSADTLVHSYLFILAHSLPEISLAYSSSETKTNSGSDSSTYLAARIHGLPRGA